MKIGIDLDDVLSKTTAAFIDFHNKYYGTTLDIKTKKKYGWWEIIEQPRDVYEERLKKFNTTPYFKDTQPVEGAREILEKLKNNNELFIITARGEDTREVTEKWIENNYPNIFNKTYYTNLFGLTGEKMTKATVCDNLDIDVYIDDSLNFALDCAKPNRKVFLLNYPWNQTDKLPEGVARVNSWNELGKLIS